MENDLRATITIPTQFGLIEKTIQNFSSIEEKSAFVAGIAISQGLSFEETKVILGNIKKELM